MEVLWWLAPPLAATGLAMAWAGWRGRERDEVRRDSSDQALAQLGAALDRPLPRQTTRAASVRVIDDATHGVAVRRAARVDAPQSARR
jgi:hypothetical protein